QSHTMSSITALGTMGVVAPLIKLSRIAMIRSFGDSALPVLYAGHASWHRPHSVHDIVSSICFHVMSLALAAPKRTSASGASKLTGSRRPRARVRPKKTLMAATRMCRCFEYGRQARDDRRMSRWPHTPTRSVTGAMGATTWDRALEMGAQAAG